MTALKNAMKVDIAEANKKSPGMKRDFFEILLPIRNRRRQWNRKLSVTNSCENMKIVNSS